jgi:hypothetical protein
MYRLRNGGAQKSLVVAAALVVLALVVLSIAVPRSRSGIPKDYEECVEQVRVMPASNDQQGVRTTNCDARFAARRKAGGGYTYYDFMQDRKFDIAGPNPTAEERKQIDREYMGFLDAQRREAVSAQLAIRQNERFRAELENARQPVGPPMVLTPLNPTPLNPESLNAVSSNPKPLNPKPLNPKPLNSEPLNSEPAKRQVDRAKSIRCEEASLSCSWAKLSAAVKNAFASSATRP